MKISHKAKKFTIAVGSAAKARQMREEMKESPAYEAMEKKLMKKYAPKMKMGGGKKRGKK